MRGFIYGMDYYSTWMMFVFPAIIIAFGAQILIKNTYMKYSRISSGVNYTGAEVARIILDRRGLTDIPIERVQGELTDHYDPIRGVVRLSDRVYRGNSISSLAIAAHEVGHALQHDEGYVPLKFRTAIAPIASIGSNLVWFFIFLGFIASSFFIELAIALFLGVVLFQIITLPVEFNASRRAIIELEDGIIAYDKSNGAKKVLSAAALTYVAGTLVAIGELLRILAYVGDRRD